MNRQDEQDSNEGWGEKLEEMLAALDDNRLESGGGTTDPDPVSASGETKTPTGSSEVESSWLAELRRDLQLSEEETEETLDSEQATSDEEATPSVTIRGEEGKTPARNTDKENGNGNGAIAHSAILPLMKMESAMETRVTDEQYEELLEEGDRMVDYVTPRSPLKELRVQLIDTSTKTAETVQQEKKPKAKPRTAMLQWLTDSTLKAVEDNILGEEDARTCGLCADSATYSKRRIRIHLRQHLCLWYCQCGFHHPSRDSVYVHQKKHGRTDEHGGADGPVYAVDAASYSDFCDHLGWRTPPEFGHRNTTLLVTRPEQQIRAVYGAHKPAASEEPTIVRQPRPATQALRKPLALRLRIHPSSTGRACFGKAAR